MSSWTREIRPAITVTRGVAVAVMAAAVRLPKRRHAEEAEPNPGASASGARRQGRRSSARSTDMGSDDQSPTPKGCLTSSNLAGEGACIHVRKTCERVL
jgi:hypothetical protein